MYTQRRRRSREHRERNTLDLHHPHSTRKFRTPPSCLCALSIISEGSRAAGKSKIEGPPPLNKTPRGTPSKYMSCSQKRNTSTTHSKQIVVVLCVAATTLPCLIHSAATAVNAPASKIPHVLHTQICFEDPSPFKTNFRRSGALYVDAVPSTFISLFVGRFSIKNEVNRSKTLDGGASQIFELKFGHDPSHGQYGTGGRTHVRTKTTSHTHSLTRK